MCSSVCSVWRSARNSAVLLQCCCRVAARCGGGPRLQVGTGSPQQNSAADNSCKKHVVEISRCGGGEVRAGGGRGSGDHCGDGNYSTGGRGSLPAANTATRNWVGSWQNRSTCKKMAGRESEPRQEPSREQQRRSAVVQWVAVQQTGTRSRPG